MYSLPGYIEKKRSELKIVIKVKNDPIMIRAVLQKKSTYFEFEVNCKSKVYYQRKKSKEVELRLRKP